MNANKLTFHNEKILNFSIFKSINPKNNKEIKDFININYSFIQK